MILKCDEHSDSEESNTNSSAVSSRYSRSNSNGYYSKYSYSSQSTPARRRHNQYDGSTKSTRSSSTTSENKIIFNEDEYTRITTPRQDVLFKKGYLNKPKTYHTQTSTGNSTISTGNSTENGTPDHQSTDLDYESQFMFPNGFVDQNGIYYVNSYEPYPLMLFNPPTYYQEFSSKTKRYSTGSLSESMSPNNEEATSQDLSQSGGDVSNGGVSDYSGGPPVYNMIYPGYYVNGVCTPPDLEDTHQYSSEPVKKLKKRRERKSSKTVVGDSSECTDENSDVETTGSSSVQRVSIPEQASQVSVSGEALPVDPKEKSAETQQRNVNNADSRVGDKITKTASEQVTNIDQSLTNCGLDQKTDSNEEISGKDQVQCNAETKRPSVLKADAEEFFPRVYQPCGPPPHIKMIPPNFMPIPLVPLGEFAGQSFTPHPAFIPPGFPINFIPQHLGQKMFPPPAPGYVNYTPPIVGEPKINETNSEQHEVIREENERETTATPSHTPIVDDNKLQVHSKVIDIATVVSKLEAVKQQEKQDVVVVVAEVSKPVVNESRPFRSAPKYSKTPNFKRNYYKSRNSPLRNLDSISQALSDNSPNPIRLDSPQHLRQSPARNDVHTAQITSEPERARTYRNSPARQSDTPQITKPHYANGTYSPKLDHSKQIVQNKNWKPNHSQSNFASNSPKRMPNYQPHQSFAKPLTNGFAQSNNKNYSQSLRQPPAQPAEPKTVCVNTVVLKKSNEDPKIVESKSKANNQWISVNNRKKKKNKSIDADSEPLQEMLDLHDSSDRSSDFESYDVNQLVDVIPTSEVEASKNHEKRIEDILSTIAQTETAELQPANISNIPEVSDIEKDIIVKIEEQQQPSNEPNKDDLLISTEPTRDDATNTTESTKASVEPIANDAIQELEHEENSLKLKKKSKKGTQKPLMKKIIITDIFNDAVATPEMKTPIKKVEETKSLKAKPEMPPVAIEEAVEVKVEDELSEEKVTAQLEKKTRKKKKNKSAKPVSNFPSELADDSALENSALNEVIGKTNDEVSLELDQLIQKGMFSSLQEKMKCLSVEPETDEFFKNVGAIVAPGKDKPAPIVKAPDFNRIFQSTRQFLKPNMVSDDNSDIKVDVGDNDDQGTKTCSSTTDDADPGAGLVLEHASHAQSAPLEPETPVEEERNVPQDDKKLYPITQAVMEWMCKTRDATPEVEILKSPSDIQKEFGNNEPTDHLDSDLDEEVTIFSSEETLSPEQPDLLEYWENELPVVSKDCDLSKDVTHDASKICADSESCDKCRTDSIKQDDEQIEVYESKYGQNEAFLNLQQDIGENPKDVPHQKHLPYRGVCCSLQ
ncbi:hypothetical protein HUJ04_000923 [Dendroctonus ponderosae]|uniref:Uncharacterized protein n=1 Tax=Dendroctonus ponderosae TaxID=77166 RepID=A0AAR5Q8W4_DENPD|nr:hypothetical protein HUJ04_000923 [Dendroctonus ponderosae]